MFEQLKKFGEKAKNAISTTALLVGDINGDGKVDEQDARIAANWAKDTAATIGDEASRLGKEALRSDIVRDAASGAAVGAVMAIPIPLIGPAAGAALGAGVGVYKNLGKRGQTASVTPQSPSVAKDAYAELLKLDELRQRGIITDTEFNERKKVLLSDRS